MPQNLSAGKIGAKRHPDRLNGHSNRDSSAMPQVRPQQHN